MNEFHTPVMVTEVTQLLQVASGKRFIDATVGGGGHTQAIIQAGGTVLGIDQDPDAVGAAAQRLSPTQAKVVLGNFAHLDQIAQDHNFHPVDGILFDLGVSSHQLDTPSRGFSFQTDSPLDMRMDPTLAVTAQDLVNALGRKELYALFTRLAQENRARAIADAIVSARRLKPITTTKELAQIVERISTRHGHLHPATKVFQALRIAVNDELNYLTAALPQALSLLTPRGRLVVLSWHEGEDRIVKHFFRDTAAQGRGQILTPKPLTPTLAEIGLNPRARSAKLRALVKL